jgi:hypothetical protein
LASTLADAAERGGRSALIDEALGRASEALAAGLQEQRQT